MSNTLDITFTNLSQLSRAYGAPAVDLAGRVLQQSAHGQIIYGIGAGIACAVVLVLATVLFFTNKDEDGFLNIFGILLGAFAVIGSIPLAIFSFVCLTDTWAWTALSDPNLALAHKIFGSMGGN